MVYYDGRRGCHTKPGVKLTKHGASRECHWLVYSCIIWLLKAKWPLCPLELPRQLTLGQSQRHGASSLLVEIVVDS